MSALAATPRPQITRKGPEATEPIVRINIVLNNVEREVIEPAKTPHTSAQQQDGPEPRVLEDQDSGCHQACDEE